MEDSENKLDGVVAIATDVVRDAITGLPAPIKRSLLKAVSQLCTAAINYPITIIDNAPRERTAESNGRIKLVETATAQIAKRLDVSGDYVDAASIKFAEKVVRERKNIDRIVALAAEDLRASTQGLEAPENETGEPSKEINTDWLSAFESEASNMSSDQMQNIFAKILSREVSRPGEFSIKTVRTIAQMDSMTANIFRKFCSLAISQGVGEYIIDVRLVAVSGASAANNSLMNFGISFDSLNVLFEHGLIISDWHSYREYDMSVLKSERPPLSIKYANKTWTLLPKNTIPSEVKVHGVMLTNTGKELFQIVDVEEEEEDKNYTIALIDYFENKFQLRLLPVNWNANG